MLSGESHLELDDGEQICKFSYTTWEVGVRTLTGPPVVVRFALPIDFIILVILD